MLLVSTTAWLSGSPARAGATRDLEQSAVYFDECSGHFGQLEHDAREAARVFCAELGGIEDLEPFVQDEEIVRVNEFSKKYSCTVRGKVKCFADP
jgi:hypothetical protein